MEKKKKVVLDHYKVLGLPSGQEGAKLNETEITKAYRAKALQLYPDKRPNSLRLDNKPSEPPNRDEGNDQVHLFLVGLLILVIVSMIFPNARSGINTLKRLGSCIEGFLNLAKCTRSGLWSDMVRTLGCYFKRSPPPPPPPQATTNQESQVEDHEDNKESQVNDHEDIEVSIVHILLRFYFFIPIKLIFVAF